MESRDALTWAPPACITGGGAQNPKRGKIYIIVFMLAVFVKLAQPQLALALVPGRLKMMNLRKQKVQGPKAVQLM